MTIIHYVESGTTHADPFVVDVPKGWHWLVVMTKTPAQFLVDGELKTYPAHCAVVYPPSQRVHYRACTEHYINDWIRFETDEPYITESPLPPGMPFALIDPDYCSKLIELLVIEHRYEHAYKKSSVDFLLRTLFNKLLESYFHGELPPRYYNLLRLRTAIQNDPGAGWTVARMAEYVQVSPGYLQNIYKRTFGISCMDDVIRSRIRMAQEHLILNTQSIAEIASHCGYQHVEHFCRQFKQVTGVTPKQYQKLAGN